MNPSTLFTNDWRTLKLLSGFMVTVAVAAACGGSAEPEKKSIPVAALPVGVAPMTATTPSTPITLAESSSPPFNLKGFKLCGKQDETLDLKVRTHVALGVESENKFVYLYNQIGKVKLDNQVFGSWAVDWTYNNGYCKPVTADNNDAAVFSAAIFKVKEHLDGTAVMTAAELQEQNDRITQTTYTLADNKTNITRAFDVIKAYEVKEKGPFFINTKTKGGFPNSLGKSDGFEIDRAVLAIQQSIFDFAYTPAGLATYRDTLVGKKFNSSDWFPGKVKAPAIATAVYTAKINANMAEDVGIRTAFSKATARRPTGYYLAAGDIAKVTVPASLVNNGFEIRVGASVHFKDEKSVIERPFRISNKFPIVSEVTEIANPHGGGIYIDVPYLAKGGASVEIKIQNVVPAPFFSGTTLNPTTLKQWQEIQRNNPAPWADFEGEKFMMTLPTRLIYKYDDPVTLMKDWDSRMDVVTDLVGRSRSQNNKVLYMAVDTSISGSSYSIGYPTGNTSLKPGDDTDGNGRNWFLTPGKDFWWVELHELGHAQGFSYFPGEGEASVNLLSVAISNKLYKVDIDTALGKSVGDRYEITREAAAANWTTTANFRAGKPMDTSSSEKDEVRYQQRGYAKYVEIAALFGWDKLEKFWAEENRLKQLGLTPVGTNLEAVNSRILRMSIAAGVDLTPLIHFWGVQPSITEKNAESGSAALAAAMKAANLQPSAAIYDRLKLYRSQIPMNNAAFKVHASTFLNKPADQINGVNKSPDFHEGWYAAWLGKYGEAEGQASQAAMDNILNRYFPNGRPAQ